MKEELFKQVKKAPMSPGVYLMKDEFGTVLYIGKAKKLRSRISSYFKDGIKEYKTRALVKRIYEFDYILTKDEQEALLLEANLIKENKPKYNILLKDDKNYPFARISLNEKYPGLTKVRNKDEKGKIYGPYANNEVLMNVVSIIHEIFPIKKCQINLSTVKRPCLYYDMGKCIAPCKKDFNQDDNYKKMIDQINSFFEGNTNDIINILEEKREEFAGKFEFEKAMYYRDAIVSINELRTHPNIVSGIDDEIDFVALYENEEKICICVLVKRDGKLIDSQIFVFNDKVEDNNIEFLEKFLTQYYSDSSYIPKRIYISEELNTDILSKYLTSIAERKIKVHFPKKGKGRSSILMALENAKEYLDKFKSRIIRKEKKKYEIEKILFSITGKENINRIESYDISHLYGHMSVGSMIVYEDFEKKKSAYRKFKINHNKGINDIESLKEIVTRRFKRLGDKKFGNKADIILVDGGIQQLNIVEEVVKKFNENTAVIAMAKDKNHKTDHLIFKGKKIELKKNTNIYRFIYSVQEEVHRFAINYHKKLRGRSIAFSVLDDIAGVGERRKTELMKKFITIDAIMKAELDELESCVSMDKKSARSVYDYFR